VAAAFPQLEILELIGQGGMGCVFKARQPQLNRFVALKLLPEALGREAAFAARFAREAQALAALSHPNIVTIHDFGQAGGFFYLLMEYVDGVNLRQALRGGRFTPEQALAIVPPLCDALQFAHDRGIVHRDIKPENLLLDRDGRIKIADFGIAKLVGPDARFGATDPTDRTGSGWAVPLEQSNVTGQSAAGTPGYMAPEQKTAPRKVDRRADIYSLGVVFYEMLTGELPSTDFQPPSRKVQVDVRLDEIVLRALEKDPELRYQQASVLKTDVETVATTSPATLRDEGWTARGQGNQGLASLSATEPGPQVPPAGATGLDYRSRATLFGLPLLHVTSGIDPQTGRARVARGIVAIGGQAQGVVAIGGVATGGLAIGGLAMGVLSVGGCALGLVAFGGLALALVAAFGGGAIAPVAMGGGAIGYFAFGGAAMGAHVLDSMTNDPVAARFFLPWAQTLQANSQWLTVLLLGLTLPVGIGVPLWLQRRQTSRARRSTPPVLPSVNCPLNMEEWLALLDAGHYAQSWKLTAPAFQHPTTEAEWIGRMQQTREPLGKVRSRRLKSAQFTASETRFGATYETNFEGGCAAETVTYAKQANGQWQPMGYGIQPVPIGQRTPLAFGPALGTVAVHGVVGMLLVAVLVFVVPRFVALFNGMGVALPTITALVISLATNLQRVWFVCVPLLLMLLALDFAVCLLLERLGGRRLRQGWNVAVVLFYGAVVLGVVWALYLPLRALTAQERVDRTGKAARSAEDASWTDYLRLNQAIAPGVHGSGSQGGPEFRYEIVFDEKAVALTVSYRKSDATQHRVQLEDKRGRRRSLGEGGLSSSTRQEGGYEIVAEKKILSRAELERVAALVLQKQVLREDGAQLLFEPPVEMTLPLSDLGYSASLNLESGEMQLMPSSLAMADWSKSVQLPDGIIVIAPSTNRALAVAGTSTQVEPLLDGAASWDNPKPAQLDIAYELEPGQTVSVTSEDISPPATFAFRTKNGFRGLLKITGFTEKPRGVRIRYRRVEAMNSPSVPATDALDERLRMLRARLADLRLRYTEESPMVKTVLAQIQELEAKAKSAAETPSTQP
jgi:tRNA A-37 threonylcarbamoyl transferase component Bud32